MTLTCQRWGRAFYRKPSYVKKYNPEVCSAACRYTTPTLTCEHCGKTFTRKQSQVSKYGRHFCSTTCHALGKTLSPEERRRRRALACKKWSDKNRDKVATYYKPEKQKKYREANREKLRRWFAEYHQKHAAVKRARSMQWRKDNPDRYKANHRASQQTRRARELKAEGRFTRNDINIILHRQKERCVYCGASLKKSYHIDHVVPLSKGGTNWPQNIQLLCAVCNRAKAAKLPEEYGRSIGLLL